MPSFFASRIAEILLVGVDDEDHVRRAAHLADAAQRLLELVLLALEPEPLLLGQPAGAASSFSSIDFSRAIDCETVFQLVSVPPSQRWFM